MFKFVTSTGLSYDNKWAFRGAQQKSVPLSPGCHSHLWAEALESKIVLSVGKGWYTPSPLLITIAVIASQSWAPMSSCVRKWALSSECVALLLTLHVQT